MNVDIVCEFGSLNGGENSMLALLPILRRNGVRLRILCPPESPLSRRVQELDIEPVPFSVEPGESSSRRREKLVRLLWPHHPDLLHANSISTGRLTGPVGSTFLRPSIVHFRDIIRLSATAVQDLNRHDRILTVSEATRRFHLRQGIDSRRCHVLYNGIDTDRFRPAPPTGYLHRLLGMDPGARLLAVIGQIGLRKGQDQLLDWLVPVFRQRKNVHLLVIGRRWSEKEETIHFEQNLRNRCGLPPFEGRVHWLGVRDDIPALLNELAMLVHSARQEPLGRVLLEAAACAVPVVATDVGGTREIFPDPDGEIPETAMVVSQAMPESFTTAVLALLDDEALRLRIGRAARTRIEEFFSCRKAADLLLRHYEDVLNRD